MKFRSGYFYLSKEILDEQGNAFLLLTSFAYNADKIIQEIITF